MSERKVCDRKTDKYHKKQAFSLVKYKLLSCHLPTKFLQPAYLHNQAAYLHNLISVQSSGRTRSSSVVTLARPSVSSSLQITNRSFRYASPHLWNKLPSSFRQPHCVHSPPGSPHPTHITLSQSSSAFSPSVTHSTFHSRLKTNFFANPFLHSHSFRTAFTDLNLYCNQCIKGALALFVLLSFSGYVC